ncbi:Hypothetical protein D9617_17g046270 [Elsinoe fawcettii]|nr:Hypothetical protein D9617_17g046270 [Elsinoe fawcettii]
MATTNPSEDGHKSWTKDDYTLTTDPSAIDVTTLNTFFASEDMYWAQPLPIPAVETMISSSLNFTLLRNPSPTSPSAPKEVVGYARCITDHVIFAYLTDVYIVREHQGRGLGKWMIARITETFDAMPHLRRSMMVTGDWEQSVPFYERMGYHRIGEQIDGEGHDRGLAVLTRLGKGGVSRV